MHHVGSQTGPRAWPAFRFNRDENRPVGEVGFNGIGESQVIVANESRENLASSFGIAACNGGDGPCGARRAENAHGMQPGCGGGLYAPVRRRTTQTPPSEAITAAPMTATSSTSGACLPGASATARLCVRGSPTAPGSCCPLPPAAPLPVAPRPADHGHADAGHPLVALPAVGAAAELPLAEPAIGGQ